MKNTYLSNFRVHILCGPLMLLLALVCLSCGQAALQQQHSPSYSGNTGTAASPITVNANQRTNSSQASDNGGYNLQAPISPDPKLTPGDTLDVTKEDICTPGYSKKVRNVPQAVKEQAYREYGIASRQPGEYEVDHLISLELGGSNSLKNLWPESFQTHPWNAHVKDALENKLHEMICSGQIDIKVAQREIATDWIAAYKKYVKSEPGPTHAHSARQEEDNSEVTNGTGSVAAAAGGAGKNGNSRPPAETKSTTSSAADVSGMTPAVVGNKKSHIYHRRDCPDYEKVSPNNRVEFSSAAEAERAGYRVAGNCPKL